MTQRPLTRNRRGSAVLSLMVITSMFLMANTMVLTTVNQRAMQDRVEGNATALAVAEAGVQRVLWEYNYNGGTLSGTEWTVVSGNCATNCTKQYLGYPVGTDPVDPAKPLGTADIVVEGFGTQQPIIRSTSRDANTQARTRVVTQLGPPPLNPFTGALVANGDLLIQGAWFFGPVATKVDGYSSASAYGGANMDLPADIGVLGDYTIHINGNNSTDTSNPTQVFTDAYGFNIDEGTSAPTVIEINNGNLTGTALAGGIRTSSRVQMPEPCTPPNPMPAGCTNNNGQLQVLSGSTCTLAGGTYCFPKGAYLEGDVVTTGKVKLYVADTVEIMGAVTPHQNRPLNLQVYSVENSPGSLAFNIQLNAAGPIMGAFYHDPALNGGVTILRGPAGDFYGSIVAGGSMSVTTANVHFDRSALTQYGYYSIPKWLIPGLPASGKVVTSWVQEQP